jgi:DNA-directed RNA polymerase specialized sigma24 family protein
MRTFESSVSQKIAPTTSQAMLEPDSATQKQLKSWERFIDDLVNPKEPQPLRSFVVRTLGQFHLSRIHDEVEIISSVYMAGRKEILSGKTIDNFSGWFRAVALRTMKKYYKEEKREGIKRERLENIVETVSDAQGLVNEDFSEQQVDTLINGWKRLNERERKILLLRIDEELSWKDIGTQLVFEKYENDDNNLVTRVRKKGNRALHKLREFCK